MSIDLVVLAHLHSATHARLHAADEPWGRALAWWRAAAELAPALPLGLVADLGALLTGAALPVDPEDEYLTFLRQAATTPAIRTARTLAMRDSAIAALLAHLAQGAPIPSEYRLPLGTRPTAIATALSTALSLPPPAPGLLPPAPASRLLPPASRLLPPASCLIPHHAA